MTVPSFFIIFIAILMFFESLRNFCVLISFHPLMNTPEEQDPSWQLLLKSKPKQANPAFVRDVVREIRKLEADAPNSTWSLLFAWLKRPAIALPVAVAASAAVFASLTLLPNSAPSTTSPSTPIIAIVDILPPADPFSNDHPGESTITEDIEQIDYLDELVATADPADLDDDALASLFASTSF